MEQIEVLHKEFFRLQKNLPNPQTVQNIRQKVNFLKKPLTDDEKQVLENFNIQKQEIESELEKLTLAIKQQRDLLPPSIKYAQILLDFVFKVDLDLEDDEEIDLESNNLDIFLSQYVNPLSLQEKNVIFEYYDPILQESTHWNLICVLFLFSIKTKYLDFNAIDVLLKSAQFNIVTIHPIEKIAIYVNDENKTKFEEMKTKFKNILGRFVLNGGKINMENFRFLSPEILALIQNTLDDISGKQIILPTLKPSEEDLVWNYDLENFPNFKRYYFDGQFVVVQFAKGTKFYHGSALLANAAVAYPAGVSYYNPVPLGTQDGKIDIIVAKESPFDIETLLTEYIPVDAGWFASAKTAKIYTTKQEGFPGCKDFCVHAYVLKEDVNFILLNNDYNILKMMQTLPESKSLLMTMFGIKPNELSSIDLSTMDKNAIIFKNKSRFSAYGPDLKFAKLVCPKIIYGNYAGYCAPQQSNASGEPFHEEFIFCNPFLFLKRDLKDMNDMYFIDEKNIPPYTALLFNQMEMYESVNTNFHSGNLLEHSIWSLLFAESICQKLGLSNIRFIKLCAIAALVHDIGKMDPFDRETVYNITRKKQLFYALQNHPIIGYNYFESGLPLLDANGEKTNARFDLTLVLKELLPDITNDEIKYIATAVKNHYEFGTNLLQPFYTNKTLKDVQMKNYARNFDNKIDLFMTLIISLADIYASQPFSANKLRDLQTSDDIKKLLSSEQFPFIKTRPKNYRGTNLVSNNNYETVGIQLMNFLKSFYNL
jgi:hypothetical protein